MSSSRKAKNSFEIAPGISNIDWKKIDLKTDSPIDDWKSAIRIFQERINRFLEPIRVLMGNSDSKTAVYSGFATMTLDCLLIETLQSFRIGRANRLHGNDRYSTQAFIDFLTERQGFKNYFDESKSRIFYNHFRCGILHQGEIKSSGLIRIDTADMVTLSQDNQSLVINRLIFHEALLKEVELYKNELIDEKNKDLRENFIKKMNEISRI